MAFACDESSMKDGGKGRCISNNLQSLQWFLIFKSSEKQFEFRYISLFDAFFLTKLGILNAQNVQNEFFSILMVMIWAREDK